MSAEIQKSSNTSLNDERDKRDDGISNKGLSSESKDMTPNFLESKLSVSNNSSSRSLKESKTESNLSSKSAETNSDLFEPVIYLTNEENKDMFTDIDKTDGSLKRTQSIGMLEKGPNDSDQLHSNDNELKQELSGFHIQMIAIGGSVGTGLFIGIGKALADGGPAALLICYVLVSVLIYCTVQALGELAVTMPVPGAFSKYSCQFLDESWGFAMGWNYAMSWMILLPLELSASALTFQYWPTLYNSIPNFWLITIFFGLIILSNSMSVKFYGVAEVLFSLVKVIAVMFFLLFGVIMHSKGDFSSPSTSVSDNKNFWKTPGAFSNGFPGILSVFVTAAFSFSGTELVGLTAAESKNAREQVPKATKQVFWRICFFYFSSIILIGLLVPYNHPNLIQTSASQTQSKEPSNNVDTSPFVIALAESGIRCLPSIMNVVILISILSVGNSAVYAASRTLTALSNYNHAPNFLKFIDKEGRPVNAILLTLSTGILAYISCFSEKGAEVLFTWLVAIAGLSSLFTWGSICLCHIRFRAGLIANNRNYKEELPFTSQVGTTGSWSALILIILVLVAQIFNAIFPINGHFTMSHFLQEILAIPIIMTFYGGHKLFTFLSLRKNEGANKCLKFYIRTSEMDLDSGRIEVDKGQLMREISDEKLEFSSKPWWVKIYKVLC